MKTIRKSSFRPVHHSAGDWDLSQPTFEITNADFVSPPSSIRVWSFATSLWVILCKHPSTLQLPQGRIITQTKIPGGVGTYHFQFRNTASPGNANRQNCYEVNPVSLVNFWQVQEYVNDILTRDWTAPRIPWDITQWTQLRLTWWLSWGLLQVRLERMVAGVWVQEGTDISIEDPLFGEETYQRPGIQAVVALDHNFIYFDDTEIWIPA